MTAILRRGGPLLAAGLLLCLSALAVVDATRGGWYSSGPAMLAAAVCGLLVGATCGAGLGSTAVLLGATLMAVSSQIEDPEAYTPANDLLFFLIVVAAPALVGATWAGRNRQICELEEASRRLGLQRDAEVRAARVEERNRIASRIHADTIQAMGAIVWHASGAARGPAADLDRSLARIEESARAALDELRGHLGSLRGGEPLEVAGVESHSAPPRKAPEFGLVDLLSAACAVPVAVESVIGGAARGPAAANVLLALAMVAPLGLRRRQPLIACGAFLMLCVVMSAVLTPLPATVSILVPMLLFAYTAGAHVAGWSGRVVCLAVVVVGVGLTALVSPAASRDPEGFVPTLVCLALAFGGGVVSDGRATRVRHLALVLEDLERGRAVDLRLAAARQRLEVARDLHDSVAAAMTVVCVRAAGARRLPVDQSDGRRVALAAVAEAARRGVAELRTSVDTFDGRVDGLSLDLARVVAEARRSGVQVQFQAHAVEAHDVEGRGVEGRGVAVDGAVEGRGVAVDGAVEHLVARVVREALVNATRHAPGAAVRIEVNRGDGGVDVTVTDSGPADGARPLTGAGTGQGLPGLAERLTAVGGELEYGLLGGGFRVWARVPSGVAANVSEPA